MKTITALEAEIIQFQEAKTYFKPTNKGNVLLDDLDTKIATAKNKLDQKHAEAYELKKSIDLLKNKGSE
jgi:predicted transcriptional regulator